MSSGPSCAHSGEVVGSAVMEDGLEREEDVTVAVTAPLKDVSVVAAPAGGG